ncbi:MAG: DUF1501 domain-containing protein, partial [Halocynthiibacter sp.]
DDVLFRDAVVEAMDLAEALAPGQTLDSYGEAAATMERTMQAVGRGARRGKDHVEIAKFAASQLLEETRIAAFSLNGWDTHSGQAGGIGRALGQLSDVVLALRDGLGPVWGKTAVLMMTEFGRTLRENGTRGTDHGTGGAMVLAGGALRGGRVFGAWPGLGEGELYQDRDLLATTDVRAFAGAAMRGLFGLSVSQLESAIFPGLDMAGAPELVL